MIRLYIHILIYTMNYARVGCSIQRQYLMTYGSFFPKIAFLKLIIFLMKTVAMQEVHVLIADLCHTFIWETKPALLLGCCTYKSYPIPGRYIYVKVLLCFCAVLSITWRVQLYQDLCENTYNFCFYMGKGGRLWWFLFSKIR